MTKRKETIKVVLEKNKMTETWVEFDFQWGYVTFITTPDDTVNLSFDEFRKVVRRARRLGVINLDKEEK